MVLGNTTIPLRGHSETRVAFRNRLGMVDQFEYKINAIQYGNLTRSQGEEAAVEITWICTNLNVCGTSHGSNIIVLGLKDSKLVQIESITVSAVKSMKIHRAQLQVITLEYHDDDANCCPTLVTETRFRESAGRLTKSSSKILRRKKGP
jgi:hypothetical protein